MGSGASVLLTSQVTKVLVKTISAPSPSFQICANISTVEVAAVLGL